MPHALPAGHGLSEAGTRWCAGLPCVAEERLTEVQRAAAEREYARARNGFLRYAAAAAVLLPAGLVVYFWTTSRPGQYGWLALAAAVAVCATLLPICAARALDHGRTALPLRRDLEDGFLWVFEGRLAAARYEEEDPEVAQLLAADLIQRGEQEQRISVLPRSGRLVRVNGQNVRPERRLHVATTATWPGELFRYSLPPDVKEVFGPSARELKRRRIAAPERAELHRYIVRLTALPWLLILLTAVMSTCVSLWLVRDRFAVEDLLAPVSVALWLWAALRHLRGYALARRLEADLEVGWLLSWQADGTGAGPSRDPREARRPPFEHAEVLPVSQRDWTIDGKPAAWRRVLSRGS